MNDHGLIVGCSELVGNLAQRAFAFDLTTGRHTELGTLGGTTSHAWAVNNQATHAFLHDMNSHTMTDLFDFDASAESVNSSGLVVGL